MRWYDGRNFNLLRELTLAQQKLKDQSTFFGFLWSFLNPLFMVVVLFVFFRSWLGGTVEHYGVYLLVGLVQYTHFANTTSASMRALVTMRALTKDTVLPKELLVVSSTISHTVDFAIALGFCVIVAYIVGVAPSWTLLFLPLVLLLQLLLVLGVSLLLSCLFPLARDIEHIYQVFLRALLFLTPVFYTRSFLGAGLAHTLVVLNPLAQLIALSRDIVLEHASPSPGRLAALLVVNGLLAGVAYRVFKAFEPRLAEYV